MLFVSGRTAPIKDQRQKLRGKLFKIYLDIIFTVHYYPEAHLGLANLIHKNLQFILGGEKNDKNMAFPDIKLNVSDDNEKSLPLPAKTN